MKYFFLSLKILTLLIFFINSAYADKGLSCYVVGKSEFNAIKIAYKETVKDARKNRDKASDIRGSLFRELFQECILPFVKENDLTSLSDKKLKVLFNIISDVQFYSHERDEAEYMHFINESIRDKGGLKPRVLYIYEAFVRARMFEEIRLLSIDYPRLVKIPLVERMNKVKSGAKTTFGLVKGSSEKLFETSFSSKDKQVVVISQPNCNFSKEARSKIAENENWRNIFEKHATWLIPANVMIEVEDIAKDKHADYFPFEFVDDEDNWKNIDNWSTPVFYFFEDGELVSKVIGWSSESREKINDSLKRIGLL